MFIEKLLQLMSEKKASDIFISAGSPLSIKINGTIMPVNPAPMDAEQTKKIAYEMLSPRQIEAFEKDREMNFAERFRAARTRGDAAAAMRMAHDLKSVSGSLAVSDVHQAASKLERACLDGDDDARLETLLQDVDRPLGPVLVQLKTL